MVRCDIQPLLSFPCRSQHRCAASLPSKVSVQRCTAALRSFAGARAWERALAFLDEMRTDGPQPNVICFNAGIAACGRGHVGGAVAGLALLRDMPRANVSPNTVSYNATITALGRGRRWEDALGLLQELRGAHLALSAVSFGAAINACERSAIWVRATELLDEARQSAVEPNLIMLSSAINATGNASQWQHALALLKSAETSALTIDSVTTNCAISACQQGSAWEIAAALLHESQHPHPPIIASQFVNEAAPREKPDSVGSGRVDGHAPVLCEPTVDALVDAGGADGAYVDCTFGRGGHCQALLRRLSSKGRVFVFDVDPSAIAGAHRLARRDSRVTVIHRPFGDLLEAMPDDVRVVGIVADLGVSSPQLDQKHRGFSALEDGPLDLRMNPHVGVPASGWLRTVSTEELAWVIREYGEDGDPMMAARLAEAIAARVRRQPPLLRTRQLDAVVREVKAQQADNPFQQPSRLTFQAIRTHLNQEFPQLRRLLSASLERLELGGRIAVVCFKRPEVAIVRRFLREHEEPREGVLPISHERLAQLYPLLARRPALDWCASEALLPLRPSADELQANTRSRSAQTLVLQKRARACRV